MRPEKEAVMKHLGDSKDDKKKKKHHVHKVTYERAHGGGHVATEEMRDEDGNHAGTHTKVMPDNDSAHDHFEESMGDQPAAGEGDGGGLEGEAGPAGEGGAAPPAADMGQ